MNDNSQIDFQQVIMQNIQEIKRIFYVALKFSQNFDGHISKLFSLINSLLDQDNDVFMNDSDLDQLDFNNFSSLKMSSPLQQQNIDSFLQQNYNSADHMYKKSQPQDDENNLFFQTIKEQNTQMQKLIEKGEGNINHLQNMLTQVFEKILQNKSKGEPVDDKSLQKYKKQIEQLQQDLNFKNNLIQNLDKEKQDLESEKQKDKKQFQQNYASLETQIQKLINQNESFLQLIQSSSNKISTLKQEIKNQQEIFQDFQKTYYNACINETQASENYDNNFSFRETSFDLKHDFANYMGYQQYLQQKAMVLSNDFNKKQQPFQANVQSQQRLVYKIPSFKDSQQGFFKNVFYESNSQQTHNEELRNQESKETADLKVPVPKKNSVVRQSLDKQSQVSQREDSIVQMQSIDLNSMRQSHSNRIKNLSMKSDDDSIMLYFQNSYQNVDNKSTEPKSDKGIATLQMKDIDIQEQDTIKF